MVRGRGGSQAPSRVVELLRNAIAEKGQSLVEKETGLSHSMISRYKRGIGEPTQATLEKLAGYFGVTVTWLRSEKTGFDDLYNHLKTLPESERNETLDKVISLQKNELQKDLFDKYKDLINAYKNIPEDEKNQAFNALLNWRLLNYEFPQIVRAMELQLQSGDVESESPPKKV